MAHQSLICELEDAIARGSNNRCADVLRRITDLFLSADEYDKKQIELYDGVIGRLIVHVETRALAELSERLAPVDHAPPRAIHRLALDDEITVAGPILSQSTRVDETVLVTIAKTKSQAHLLAISSRKRLNEPVTDVLVDRGNAEVTRSVAANPGARFSAPGLDSLARQAETDGELAERILLRTDVPLHVFGALLMRATDVVKQRLLSAAEPEVHSEIRRIVTKTSGKVAAEASVLRNYSTALRNVLLTHATSNLREQDVLEFAQARQFEKTVAALSALCSIPLEVTDQVLCGDRIESLLILCKAVGFDWSTVRAIIHIRPGGRLSPERLVEACDDFARLSNATAQKVLRLWQIRRPRAAN
jgi:uncharacterized protein (DUF2336 family)